MKETESEIMDFQQSDLQLARIKKISIIITLLMTLGSLFFWDAHLTLAIFLGAAFSTFNFYLLGWTWGAFLQQQAQTSPAKTNKTIWLRFVIKYFVLLGGLTFLLLGLKLNLIAFGIGLGCLFLAILVDTVIPKPE